jgi:3-methyladenine DNA glycosylase AlkD
MNSRQVITTLRALGDPRIVEGMARYGITPRKALGVSIPSLRNLAAIISTDHRLAVALWNSGIHEARILAGMIEDPLRVSEHQMDRWARAFDSWDVCDQCCMNLFEDMPCAYRKCFEWSRRPEEFVRRAGYALMARLAVSARGMKDEEFTRFFPLIRKGALDGRNYVKKAVNWALRQIGKRNPALRRSAVREAKEILKLPAGSARWIARDALRELESREVRARMKLVARKP